MIIIRIFGDFYITYLSHVGFAREVDFRLYILKCAIALLTLILEQKDEILL